MIALIIVGYLLMAICTSIGFILFEYKVWSEVESIEIFLDRCEDDFIKYIGMGFVWPISLIIYFVMLCMPFIFKKLIITVNRLFTGKRNKEN